MAKPNNMTIIAEDVRIEGEFVAESDLQVDGSVQGVLKTAGDLQVGSTANVKADVSAKNATISGTVDGNLLIDGRLELREGAKISGDIVCEILAVGTGAQMNGTIRMGAVPVSAAEVESDEE
ncbi:MAG: polymer-forming cytoskeletal protein [bacterium]|nr:polymer-forming cytoskeletal protein [bacterium]